MFCTKSIETVFKGVDPSFQFNITFPEPVYLVILTVVHPAIF